MPTCKIVFQSEFKRSCHLCFDFQQMVRFPSQTHRKFALWGQWGSGLLLNEEPCFQLHQQLLDIQKNAFYLHLISFLRTPPTVLTLASAGRHS